MSMLSENIADVIDQLRSLWRNRWKGLMAAWIACLIGWAAIMTLPDAFESSARVYVDTRTPLRRVIDNRIGVEQDVTSEIDLVRQALLSRPQLEKVARIADLDNNVRSPADMDRLVDSVRAGLTINREAGEPVGGGQRDTGSALYTISYQHGSRTKSLAVVSALLDSFVEDTLGNRRSGSEVAQSFLRGQIKEYETRLSSAEAALAEFRKKNMGLLPGSDGDFFSRLDRESSGMQSKENELAVAYSRKAQLQRQLSSARPYIAGSAGGGAASGATSDLSARLQDAESRLEEMLLRYTDKHPEVVALRDTIAELKERERRELQEISRGGAGTGAIRSLNANPVYQSIQLQLNQVDVDIASLQGAIGQHKREIANLRRVVDTAPEVERELARLTRDYGVTKSQYESLLQRFEQTKVSDDAQHTGIVKFEVIDPPLAKVEPVWPNRPMLVLVTLLAGLAVGGALAFGLSAMAPTFSNIRNLAEKTGVEVLGYISSYREAASGPMQIADNRRFFIATGALVMLGLLMAVFGDNGARALQRLLA